MMTWLLTVGGVGVLDASPTTKRASSPQSLVLQQLWKTDQGPIEVTYTAAGLLLLGYFTVLAWRHRKGSRRDLDGDRRRSESSAVILAKQS